MKNTANAAMPISAITYCRFFPRRLSDRPAQVSRSPDIKSSTVPTRRLNLTRPGLKTTKNRTDSICRTPLPGHILTKPGQNENCWPHREPDESDDGSPRRQELQRQAAQGSGEARGAAYAGRRAAAGEHARRAAP